MQRTLRERQASLGLSSEAATRPRGNSVLCLCCVKMGLLVGKEGVPRNGGNISIPKSPEKEFLVVLEGILATPVDGTLPCELIPIPLRKAPSDTTCPENKEI